MAGRPRSGPSGDHDPTGYLPIALPEGPFAGEEGVVRRGLDVAVGVKRPRTDPVLARSGSSPVECPEHPGKPRRPSLAWRGASEIRRRPTSIVDSDLHCRDRRAPCGARDGVPVSTTRDFGRRRLEALVPHGGERPEGLAGTLFPSDADGGCRRYSGRGSPQADRATGSLRRRGAPKLAPDRGADHPGRSRPVRRGGGGMRAPGLPPAEPSSQPTPHHHPLIRCAERHRDASCASTSTRLVHKDSIAAAREGRMLHPGTPLRPGFCGRGVRKNLSRPAASCGALLSCLRAS
jgi:hypothetical protein